MSESAPAAAPYPRSRWWGEGLVAVPALLLLVWAWSADRSWYEHHVIWTGCVTQPNELRSFARWRWGAAALALVIVLVVRPLVARAAARLPDGELFGAAFRIGLAIVASVVAADVVLRIAEDPIKPVGYDLPLAVGDPDIGWRAEPSKEVTLSYPLDAAAGEAKSIVYITDSAGNRVRSANEPTDFTRPSILFAGESITFGLGVPFDDTYAALIGRETGLQSANLGVTAYSNDQSYLRVHEELPTFDKPVAIVTLLVQVALLRNADRRHGHVIPQEDGTTKLVARSSHFVLGSPVRDLVERRIGLHSVEFLEIARDVIRATANEARSRGAYPLFVLTNWGPACLPAEDGGSPPVEDDLFRGLDAPHLRVDLDAAWWDPAIDHPGVRAHAVLADRIVDALARAGVVSPAR